MTTTEMKQLLALLLLLCVCTIHGRRGPRDPCTNGMAAMRVFRRYEGCPPPRPYAIVEELRNSINDNPTVDNMEFVATNFCSSVLPRLVQCFEGNVQNCTEQQQLSLNTVAQQTGFFCQPNTSRVHPVVTHMFSRLSEDDLARAEECPRPPGMRDLPRLCRDRSMEAIGVVNNNMSILERLPMKDLAPKVQTFIATMFECMVTQVRDMPDRCPHWRGVVIRGLDIFDLLLHPLLGKRMTFTTQDVDRMFEWGRFCGTNC